MIDDPAAKVIQRMAHRARPGVASKAKVKAKKLQAKLKPRRRSKRRSK